MLFLGSKKYPSPIKIFINPLYLLEMLYLLYFGISPNYTLNIYLGNSYYKTNISENSLQLILLSLQMYLIYILITILLIYICNAPVI